MATAATASNLRPTGSSIPRHVPLNHHDDDDEVSSEDLSDFDDDDVEDDDDDDDDDEDPDSPQDFHEAEAAPEPEPVVEEEIDPLVAAEQAKEEGNVQFKLGRYGAAIDLYTKAHRLNDKEPAYLTNRAASLMQIKHYRSALEDCQLAAQIQQANPQPKTLLRLARCQVALGQPSQARTTLNNLLSIDSTNAEALKLRQKANLLQDHLERYQKNAAAGEWVLARLALENAESLVDGSIPVEWRVWKINIEIRRRRFDSATSAATDALRIEPKSPEVLTARALVLFLTNHIPESIKHVQSALRYDQEYKPAILLLRRAKEIDKVKEEGNSAFKAGRHAMAVQKYTETLDAIGERSEEGDGGQLRALVLNNRATALSKLDKWQEAMQDIDLSLKLHPGYFKSLRTRARIRLGLEEYEAAIEDFKSALESSMVEASTAEQKALEREIKLAEVQLKRSKGKDYYKILKLHKTCTEIEIKKAYRRESLVHHPDKGGDEEKFKLVVEAHAVLSDPQRRARYDAGGDEDGQTESSGGGYGGPGGVDLSEMFGAFGGGGGGFGGGYPGGGFPGGGRGGHSHNPFGF